MNISNLNETNFDGLNIFLENMNDYFVYVIFNFFGAIFGVFGSIVVVGAILFTKRLRDNTTYRIIANLAVADFLLSSTSDTFAIAG